MKSDAVRILITYVITHYFIHSSDILFSLYFFFYIALLL